MAKWIYVAHMGKKNPICRDIGNLEKINITGVGSWVEPESLIADGIKYHFGIKPSATRLRGFTSIVPVCNVKTGKTINVVDNMPGHPMDGEEVPFTYAYPEKDSSNYRYCDDPRILCVVNRIWNLDLRGEYNDQDKIDEAIRIPTHEEALKYLHDREYTASCISDDMKNNYFRARPGWEDRMYQPD